MLLYSSFYYWCSLYGSYKGGQALLDGYGLDDKLLLVCTKGKRAYLLQNRLKHYGYTNTLVLEGGSNFLRNRIVIKNNYIKLWEEITMAETIMTN